MGVYEFTEVPAGVYELTVSLPGFRTLRLTGLRLTQPTQQDVTLQIAGVSTQVEVMARRGPPEPVAPPSPRPSPPPPPVRVGGDIAQANLIFQSKPVYPPAARLAGVQGAVVIQAIITSEGTLTDLRVLNAEVHPDLNAAALDAVKQWRYKPTMLNGQPIATITTITVNFSLED
jgi:TonB family protein